MLNLTQLNQKAMLVRLTISKPSTSKHDSAAETFAQAQLSDQGLRVTSTLFRSKTNPVRDLLNAANAVYTYHRQNTLPYVDRGPRLLPVANYETYRDTMRQLVGYVDNQRRTVMPDYNKYVQQDIADRGARASVNDYPTAQDFDSGLSMQFTFAPLPDKGHFLFDISEEDKAALDAQMQDVIKAARADLYARIEDPLRHLVDKLKIPAGQPGSVFRDSAVENVIDAVKLARTLAMDDEHIIKICDEVAEVITTGHAKNPQVLRDSPIVREDTAAKLKAVADKMGFMMESA